jgi:hypothetical protein
MRIGPETPVFRDILTLIRYPTSVEEMLFGNILVSTERDYLVAGYSKHVWHCILLFWTSGDTQIQGRKKYV